jgi:1,4-dihydroxy-2-naphthoate octaprenyltransferase
MVFVFFGLMATAGTTFVMIETVTPDAWWSGAVLGLLAVAILEANNLRDIPTDEAAGKRTLAVRVGDRRARWLYAAFVVGAFVTIVLGFLVRLASDSAGLSQWGLFGLAAWPLAVRPLEVSRTASGRDLIPVLTGTAKVHAACGLLMALGFVLARTV